MKPVDNHTIAQVAEVVFSNSSGYYVEVPMVGREEETAVLLDILGRDTSDTVAIAAPLGAGKTFFLNTIFGLLRRRDPRFDERRNVRTVLATDVNPAPLGTEWELDLTGNGATADAALDDALELPLDLEPHFAGVEGRQVLVVEELDRKATLAQIRWSLASALAWQGRRPGRVVILTGDMTIGGRHVEEFLRAAFSPFRLTLPPLDLELLRSALVARIHNKLVAPSNPTASDREIAEASEVAADQILADDLIRWSVVPIADPALLATFRDSLGVLRTYAENAPSHEGSVAFDRSLIRSLYLDPGGLAGSMDELAGALVNETRRLVVAGKPLRAYSLEELAALAGHEATSSYSRRVVRALARKGLLVPLGVPYEDEVARDQEPSAFVGPFIPSYRTLHLALAGLVAGSA